MIALFLLACAMKETPSDFGGDGRPYAEDCAPGNASIGPSSPEICNGIDDDCAGGIDDGLAQQDWYADHDGDTHGAGSASTRCSPEPGV